MSGLCQSNNAVISANVRRITADRRWCLWAVFGCWPRSRHEVTHERVEPELWRLYLDFMRKNAGILLHNEVDVAQGDILDLTLSREQGDKGRCHLLVQRLDCGLVLNQIQLLQDDLNMHKPGLLFALRCAY